MRAEDLLDVIGEIDEKDIRFAEKKAPKPLAIWMSSLAAGLALLLILPGILMNLIGYGAAGDMAPGGASNENVNDMMKPGASQNETALDVLGVNGAYSVTDSAKVAAFEALVAEIVDTTEGKDIVPAPGGSLQEGEYRIVLMSYDNERVEYRLHGNSFTCIDTCKEYILTPAQYDEMKTILCISD